MSSSELTSRNRCKWNVNEILSLQREYELYELSIQEIALLHKRSAFSILHKLEKEQIIVNFNDARGYDKINFWNDEYHSEEDEQSDEQSYDNEHDKEYEEPNNQENVINLSLQLPPSSDSDSDDDSDSDSDHPEIVSHTQNIDDIDVVYFEDELMKKVHSVNIKKRYENTTLFDIVYELIERIECLEDKIVSIETANSNSFFAFVKNWFYAKRIC